MKGFIAGLGIGLGAAVLFAPQPGEATRRQLRRKTSEIADRAGEWVEQIPGGERLAEQAAQVTDKLRNASERAIEAGREQVEKLRQAPGSMSRPNGVKALNTASREDLIAVPGIGPVLADRIIEGRPYSSEEELTERNIIPESVFRELRRRLLQSRSA